MTDELVEKVARAMVAAQSNEWDRLDGGDQGYFLLPAYSGSIDDALLLVPEGMGWVIGISIKNEPFASVDFDRSIVAATPALAICAAALRARQSDR